MMITTGLCCWALHARSRCRTGSAGRLCDVTRFRQSIGEDLRLDYYDLLVDERAQKRITEINLLAKDPPW
jgi:hypothetical protein